MYKIPLNASSKESSSLSVIIIVIILLIGLGVGGYFAYKKIWVPRQCVNQESNVSVFSWLIDSETDNCVANVCMTGYGTDILKTPTADGKCPVYVDVDKEADAAAYKAAEDAADKAAADKAAADKAAAIRVYTSYTGQTCYGGTLTPFTATDSTGCQAACDATPTACYGYDWDGTSCQLANFNPVTLYANTAHSCSTFGVASPAYPIGLGCIVTRSVPVGSVWSTLKPKPTSLSQLVSLWSSGAFGKAKIVTTSGVTAVAAVGTTPAVPAKAAVYDLTKPIYPAYKYVSITQAAKGALGTPSYHYLFSTAPPSGTVATGADWCNATSYGFSDIMTGAKPDSFARLAEVGAAKKPIPGISWYTYQLGA